MSRRRRRRSKNRGRDLEVHEEGLLVEENETDDWVPELVSVAEVPESMVAKGLYRPGGGRCRKCEWTTRKKGFSGRQAMRAHLKLHARERRAELRPLLRQAALAAPITVAAVLGAVGAFEAEPLTSAPLGSTGLAGTFTAIALLLLAGLFSATSRAESTLSKHAIAAGRASVLMSTWLGVAAAAFAVGAVAPPLPWYGLVAPGALLLLSVAAAPALGMAALKARRGGYESPHSEKLLRPRDEDADMTFGFWQARVMELVGKGRISPRQLGVPERKAWEKAQRRAREFRERP